MGEFSGRTSAAASASADKLFFVYLADDERVIREHAQKSGLPATRIHQVKTILDPTSGNA